MPFDLPEKRKRSVARANLVKASDASISFLFSRRVWEEGVRRIDSEEEMQISIKP
jgi:hypothetical protein